MAKIPNKPEEIFSEITNDFKGIFGNELISIILYGSGARGDYIPGISDINFLFILTQKGIEDLSRALGLVTRWKKRNVATPLFMTRDYILSSLDSFPVEFLNMKRHHVLVFGEDVLAALTFQPEHLRLQIERELKAKILHLRKGYLETEGKDKNIRQLIKISLTAFAALFHALLYLKNLEVPKAGRDVFPAAAKAFPIDADVFMKCADVKEEKDHFSSSEIQKLFKDYLKEVNRLCDIIDHLEL